MNETLKRALMSAAVFVVGIIVLALIDKLFLNSLFNSEQMSIITAIMLFSPFMYSLKNVLTKNKIKIFILSEIFDLSIIALVLLPAIYIFHLTMNYNITFIQIYFMYIYVLVAVKTTKIARSI